LIGTDSLPTSDTRASIVTAFEGAGWQLDAAEAHVIEASDGRRFGVADFFESGAPVEICYGDGEQDLQWSELWHEAPGLLEPREVARLFGDERGEQG
jgi:hypothetical protein